MIMANYTALNRYATYKARFSGVAGDSIKEPTQAELITRIQKASMSGNSDLKQEVVQLIPSIEDPLIQVPLIKLFSRDDNAKVREECAKVADRVSLLLPRIDIIEELSCDRDFNVRKAAAQAALRISDIASPDRLVRLLQRCAFDAHPEVVKAAKEAIENIGDINLRNSVKQAVAKLMD
jgi:hypothetical protein